VNMRQDGDCEDTEAAETGDMNGEQSLVKLDKGQ
jgi:hypothetical protein